MSNELLDSIRAANLEFQEFMELVNPSGDGQDIDKAFRHLNRVHLRLKHISKCLATTPITLLEQSEGAQEVQQYRENLQSLKRVIEALQEKLLTEKARINNVRSNVQAARAWAESIRSYS